MSSVLKDIINEALVETLAQDILSNRSNFNAKNFKNNVLSSQWRTLELKQRIRHVATVLGQHLPGSYEQQIVILKKIAPKYNGLAGLIFPDFVEVHGQKHVETSLEALKFFTQFSSSEFAIRIFIKNHAKKLIQTLLKWSKDSNEHVRRLASEGSRPRLPWSFKLDQFIEDPQQTLVILENLKNDKSLYVRKSVANHLNDISKDHPELVLEVARKWYGKSEETNWIVKHALRTLLKRGDQRALKIFGLSSLKGVLVDGLRILKAKNKIGTQVEFSFKLVNEGKIRIIRVDYAIHYIKKTIGTSKKVFKLSEKDYARGAHEVAKYHSLKQMTTRKHYPGIHQLDIIINGEIKASTKFQVVK